MPFNNVVQSMATNIIMMVALIGIAIIAIYHHFTQIERNQNTAMTSEIVGTPGAMGANATETLDTYTNHKAE
jgi:hypothetical protein